MKLSRIYQIYNLSLPDNFTDTDIDIVFILGSYGKSVVSRITSKVLRESNKKVLSNYDGYASFNSEKEYKANPDPDGFFIQMLKRKVVPEIIIFEIDNKKVDNQISAFLNFFPDAHIVINNLDDEQCITNVKEKDLFYLYKNIAKEKGNKKKLIVNSNTYSEKFNSYFQNRSNFFKFNKKNSDIFGSSELLPDGLSLSLNIIGKKIKTNLKTTINFENILAVISILSSLNLFNLKTVSSVLKNVSLDNQLSEINVNNKKIILDNSVENNTILDKILSELNLKKNNTTILFSPKSFENVIENRQLRRVASRKEKYKILKKYAKNIIITNNKYDDNNSYIANMDMGGTYIQNRMSALNKILEETNDGETILILGGDLKKDREFIEQLTTK